MSGKTKTLGTAVTIEMYELIKKIAKMMDISPSEYLRFLIIQDLERRNFITTKIERIKREVIENEQGE